MAGLVFAFCSNRTFEQSTDDATPGGCLALRHLPGAEYLCTRRTCLSRQSAALVIIESRAFSQLLFEHPNFLFQVFDDELLVAVYPAGKKTQEEGQGIHGVIILSAGPKDDDFVGNRPVR
jgi:hypothetical protein